MRQASHRDMAERRASSTAGDQGLSAALWELILLGAKLAIDPRPIGLSKLIS